MAKIRAAQAPRLVIDGRKLGDGGIGVYIENLIDGLLTLRGFGEIELAISLLTPASRRASTPGAALRKEALERWGGEIDVVSDNTPKYSLRELYLLGSRHRKLLRSAALFHAPHYVLPYGIPCPTVVTIHDGIHVTHPESIFHRKIGGALIRSALRRANRVITVSEESRTVLERLCPGKHAPIDVVPNSLRSSFGTISPETQHRAIAALDLPAEYLLFIGSDRPHKGFASLLRAFAASAPEPVGLVCVGAEFGRGSRRTIKALGLTGRVRFLESVPSEVLVALYSSAKALVVSSIAEGFCLPVLEAMATGTPIITTPLPSVIEICGSGAWYTTGFGEKPLAESLKRFFARPELARPMIRVGVARAQRFELVQSARKTVSVYETVLKAHSSDLIRRMFRPASGAFENRPDEARVGIR